jgi:uncharacterized RDD family membrane protein YckC
MNGSPCHVCGATASSLGLADPSTGLRLAGWWRRFGATFSDNMIMLVPTYLAFLLFGSLSVLLGVLASAGVQGLYLVRLLASTRGQTIGNRIAQTRVRDLATGQRITLLQSVKRWGFVALYQTVTLLVGGSYSLDLVVVVMLFDDLWPLFDAHRQTLHDRFAATIVVMA